MVVRASGAMRFGFSITIGFRNLVCVECVWLMMFFFFSGGGATAR